MKLAKLKGAHVIAVGRREERLEIADRLGADQLVNAAKEKNWWRSFEVLQKDTGEWMLRLKRLARRRLGRWRSLWSVKAERSICLVDAQQTLRLHSIRNKYTILEITIKASFHHTPQYIRAALDVIKEGKIDAHEFISGREPLSKLPEVLDLIVNRRNGDLKVAIVP